MNIKEKITAGLPVCGMHINLSDPCVTEIAASLGFDFLWIDMEHTTLSCEQVHMHLLAARSAGTAVFVRVPADDFTITKRVLEMGPEGIIFPMVRNAEHAARLIAYTLYPPFGNRGCGPKGAVRYGIDDEKKYYGEGHLNLCRFVQIELKEAALDAERIAAIPYLDGCVLGMHDLSGSIGRLGDIFCEENIRLASLAVRAFRNAGKTTGISTFSTDPEIWKRYRDMGMNMISAGADYDFILQSARKTAETLKAVQHTDGAA